MRGREGDNSTLFAVLRLILWLLPLGQQGASSECQEGCRREELVLGRLGCEGQGECVEEPWRVRECAEESLGAAGPLLLRGEL